MNGNKKRIIDLILNTQLFTESFWNSIRDKVLLTGYVQPDTYFRHYSVPERKGLISSLEHPDIQSLLYKSQPEEDDFIDVLEKLHKIQLNDFQKKLITKDIAEAIISWLFYCNKQRYVADIRDELTNWLQNNRNDIKYVNNKYIIRVDMSLTIVDNLSSYINVILNISSKNQIFYRGQESINYWLQPSINRTERLYINESKLFQELILRCPNDFRNCKSHLDYLVEMQHYGLPTRLIDITTNPLVALYFATLGKASCGSGEVIVFDIPDRIFKYERSDTVTILSCLPLFNYGDQSTLLELSFINDKDIFNKHETVARLLHEIRVDKPAFSDRIIPADLRKNIVVTPALKNSRIIKQSGAFIITGLIDHSKMYNECPIESLRYLGSKGHPLLIIVENKEKVKNELKAFGINNATLFPEIDDVATYLKSEII